jgi:hypothetical protein
VESKSKILKMPENIIKPAFQQQDQKKNKKCKKNLVGIEKRSNIAVGFIGAGLVLGWLFLCLVGS